jgi:hypothetical protein
MKKILLISNSFGVDATRYFYGVCRKAKEDVMTVCLYISGCSLERHYKNMLSEEKAYQLYFNGAPSPFHLSLKDALLSDDWDIITLQQVSNLSGDFSTYEPYLSELSDYVKKLVPKAKQYIHAIWAWRDEQIIKHALPYKNTTEMSECSRRAYQLAAEKINADGLIPATVAMSELQSRIGDAAYRDGLHASAGIGRFMLALLWYGYIFKKDIEGIGFNDFDVDITDEEIKIAEECAKKALAENTYIKNNE